MYCQGNYAAEPYPESNIGRNVVAVGSIPAMRDTTAFSVTWAGREQAFLVASHHGPVAAAWAAAVSYDQIAATLARHRLETVHERILCSLSVEQSVMAERSRAFLAQGLSDSTPVTCIQGHPTWGEGLSGVIIQAVPAGQVRTLMDGDVPCGRAWLSNGAEFLMLQNITGLYDDTRESESRSLQTRRMLDRAERILRDNGASYGDVVRTWFYLSDILDWYAAFNKVRNEKYGEFGIMPGPGDARLLLPASTGIRGDTSSRAAAAMDLVAIVRDASSRTVVTQLTNRGQLDAFCYGAAFSRGAVITGDDAAIIQVSGTAAIDEHGVSLYPGDIRSQIGCTFDKIEGLLDQAGAGLGDICAATVFVKRPEYMEVFRETATDRGLADFPAVCVVADVCREELLFEIDAEAVVVKK